MRLAELRTLDIPALWAGLTDDQRIAIGEATLGHQFALLVAHDNGTETTRDDRGVADEMASEAFRGIEVATEDAFPDVDWWEDQPRGFGSETERLKLP